MSKQKIHNLDLCWIAEIPDDFYELLMPLAERAGMPLKQFILAGIEEPIKEFLFVWWETLKKQKSISN